MNRTSILVVFALMLNCFGCGPRESPSTYLLQQSGHRLVRISFSGQASSFKMRINEGPVERVQNASFANVMAAFKFEYGDIVVWEAVRNGRGKELTWPHDIALWWTEYLSEVRASHYCINSDDIKNFFSAPIYHWKAPATKPRPLEQASFYRNGICLGQASAGLRAMLDGVQEDRKADTPFIFAPRFKNGENEGTTDQVWGWMDEAGLSARYQGQVWPGELMDFARMMDDQ